MLPRHTIMDLKIIALRCAKGCVLQRAFDGTLSALEGIPLEHLHLGDKGGPAG